MAVKFQGGKAVPAGGSGKQAFYQQMVNAWNRGDYQRLKELAQQDITTRHLVRECDAVLGAINALRQSMNAVKNGANTPD